MVEHGEADALLVRPLVMIPGLMDPEVWLRAVTYLDVIGYDQRIRRVLATGGSRHEENDSEAEVEGYVLTWAGTSCGVAVDHMRAWHALLSGGVQPVMAHGTLCRGVLDGAVVCLWLLDGDADERRARAAGLQIRDHRERHLFEQTTGGVVITNPEGRTAAERDSIATEHLAKVRVTPRTVPRWIALYRDYAIGPPLKQNSGEGLYRLLSAFAHGQSWAFLSADLDEVDATAEVGDAVGVTAKDEFVEAFARYARAALDRAITGLEGLVPPP